MISSIKITVDKRDRLKLTFNDNGESRSLTYLEESHKTNVLWNQLSLRFVANNCTFI